MNARDRKLEAVTESREQTIDRLKNDIIDRIEEALADMIVGGEIDSINPLEIVEDYRTGALGVRVEIVLPNEQVVPLGLLPLGGGA
jgi:hypothetical protein